MIELFLIFAFVLAVMFWLAAQNERAWPVAGVLAFFAIIWISIAWLTHKDQLGYAVHFSEAKSQEVEIVTQFEYNEKIYMTVRHLNEKQLRTYYFPEPTDKQKEQEEQIQEMKQQGKIVIGTIDPDKSQSPVRFREKDDQRNKAYNKLKE